MRDENEFNGIRHVELISSILVLSILLCDYKVLSCVVCVVRSFRNGSGLIVLLCRNFRFE